MNRYRGPFSSSAASSKATSTTRCQKCLKLGHYSYECKATISERPYTSRPSRTQQFLNPRLRQELTEATPPSDVVVNKKKGTADEILMKNKNERDSARPPEVRGRKRRRNNSTSPSPVQSRARSISTSSSSTYSSISSGRSLTPPVYSQENSMVRHNSSRRQSNSHARDDHDRSVRRKYRDSPSPRRRGRRLSPTDYPRRTRSRTPRPTHRRSITPQVRNDREESPLRSRQVDENRPTRTRSHRERSLSPFTRRKLLTEQMQRIPG